MNTKNFKEYILNTLEEKFNLSGLKKVNKTTHIYTKELNVDIIAWIGLNKIIRQKGVDIGINPIIGIRHQKIEKIISELNNEKYHKYSPPTISNPIGYIMPQKTYIQFNFFINDDTEKTLNYLVNAINEYAGRFFNETSTLTSLCKKLEDREFYRPGITEYRLLCCYYLLNDYDNLKKYIIDIFNSNHDNKPLSFINEFKKFAEQLVRLSNIEFEIPEITNLNNTDDTSEIIIEPREIIFKALEHYGENEISEKLNLLSEKDWNKLNKLAINYVSNNITMGKAVSLAAIEVIEGKKRRLKKE